MAVTMPARWIGSFMPEETLLRRWITDAKAGDEAAFESILRLHERMVLRTAQRLLLSNEDAKDAAQEVFLKLHKNLARFREEQELIPWLYRITVNVCFDLLRKPGKEKCVELSTEPLDERSNPEESVVIAEQKALLAAALTSLAPKERAAIVLRDLEGCTTAEVAAILESSEATVRSQISLGRTKIRRLVAAQLRRRQ